MLCIGLARQLAVLGLVPAASVAAPAGGGPRPAPYERLVQLAAQRAAQTDATVKTLKAAANDDGGDGGGPEQIAEQAEQYAQARSAPGVVAPGASTAA